MGRTQCYPVLPSVGLWLYISAPGRPCLPGAINMHLMTVLCGGALQVAPPAHDWRMCHVPSISLFPARPPLQVRTARLRLWCVRLSGREPTLSLGDRGDARRSRADPCTQWHMVRSQVARSTSRGVRAWSASLPGKLAWQSKCKKGTQISQART